jgi:CHAD domain-containing protein
MTVLDIDDPRPATVRSTARQQTFATDPVRIVRARPVRLSRKIPVEEAFRLTVFECLAHVAANAPAILHKRDVEALHQMRVGLRRLHVALTAFGEEFRTPALKEIRKRTKAFTDAIGPARDLDVFLGELFDEPARVSGYSEAFMALRERAESVRNDAWNQAIAHVESAEFSVFLDDVAAAAETHSWFAKAIGANAFKPRFHADAPVERTAARILDGHLIKVSKRGRHMKSLSEHDRHRLRIALKKLRYAAEFFEPLYKKKHVGIYLKRLRALLEDLGALNDLVTVRGQLKQLTLDDASRNPDISFAAGLVDGWHSARADRLGQQAVKRWKKFRHTRPFWH